MAFLQVNNVEVVGMAVTVPSTIEETVSIYEKWGDYDNFVATTGIERRRKSNFTTCSSDLCLCARREADCRVGVGEREYRCFGVCYSNARLYSTCYICYTSTTSLFKRILLHT